MNCTGDDLECLKDAVVKVFYDLIGNNGVTSGLYEYACKDHLAELENNPRVVITRKE